MVSDCAIASAGGANSQLFFGAGRATRLTSSSNFMSVTPKVDVNLGIRPTTTPEPKPRDIIGYTVRACLPTLVGEACPKDQALTLGFLALFASAPAPIGHIVLLYNRGRLDLVRPTINHDLDLAKRKAV